MVGEGDTGTGALVGGRAGALVGGLTGAGVGGRTGALVGGLLGAGVGRRTGALVGGLMGAEVGGRTGAVFGTGIGGLVGAGTGALAGFPTGALVETATGPGALVVGVEGALLVGDGGGGGGTLVGKTGCGGGGGTLVGEGGGGGDIVGALGGIPHRPHVKPERQSGYMTQTSRQALVPAVPESMMTERMPHRGPLPQRNLKSLARQG